MLGITEIYGGMTEISNDSSKFVKKNITSTKSFEIIYIILLKPFTNYSKMYVQRNYKLTGY